jgi:murein DD-endopeptidase MepM/ murein hydrolase activator NlpD
MKAAAVVAIALASAAAGAAIHSHVAPSQPPATRELQDRSLAFPLPEQHRPTLRDNFAEARGKAKHEALDLMAPRGTPVLAVDDGRIAKLFTSAAGGITVYQFDPEQRHVYYYAHLDRYAAGLKEGAWVARGTTLGFVGSTGNAAPNAPHLHFAVYRLGADKRWWKGEAVNPYPLLAKRPTP